MISEIRHGASQRQVAKRYGYSLSTIQYWIKRTKDQRLDRINWNDRPPIAKKVNRTPKAIEDKILELRKELREKSDLGEYGAEAVYRELISQGIKDAPSPRTIGRIARRRGALEGKERIRRPVPPQGWYLPDVMNGLSELDSFDVVEDLIIKGGTHVDVLNGISLHGKLPGSWPMERVSAKATIVSLTEHWQEVGLPQYAQFDNDTRFQGAHQHKDSIGRVIRFCLGLGVIPVFALPREKGFQACIENYNGRWESKVWARFRHKDIPDLTIRSDRYIAAYRSRMAQYIKDAPPRRPFPEGWKLDLQAHPQGKIIYIRRTGEKGTVYILGHRLIVDKHWLHRLVRCEVDLQAERIKFYRLRRREPNDQPCLGEVVYKLPRKRFHE